MTHEEAQKLIGQRVLFRKGSWTEAVYEAKVLEVSPNGKYTKLQFIAGAVDWRQTKDLQPEVTLASQQTVDAVQRK